MKAQPTDITLTSGRLKVSYFFTAVYLKEVTAEYLKKSFNSSVGLRNLVIVHKPHSKSLSCLQPLVSH